MRESMKVRIERGIALLDKKKPTWCKKIDLEILDLQSPWRCVLGQTYGSRASVQDRDQMRQKDGFGIGMNRLGLDWFGDRDLQRHGFVYGGETVSSLTAAWKRAIKAHCP